MAALLQWQPLFVTSAATAASKMDSAGVTDLHGATDVRDDEWLDVVAPSEYFLLLTLTPLVLCTSLVPPAHQEL